MRRGRFTHKLPRPLRDVERDRLLSELEKILARLRKGTVDEMIVVEERLLPPCLALGRLAWQVQVVRVDTGDVVGQRDATPEERTPDLLE